MPNWCFNKVIVNDDEDFKKIANFVKGKESIFDFQVIVPIPETLYITEGSLTSRALNSYLSAINPANEEFKGITKVTPAEYAEILSKCTVSPHCGVKDDLTATEVDNIQNDDFVKGASETDKKFANNILELGKVVADNYINYGCRSWYDFCVTYWGTKWNACDVDISSDENTIFFNTAWSPPLPVILALSEKVPNIPIEIDFADSDDFGGFAGKITFMNGKIVSETCPSTSAETLELAAEILSVDLSENYIKHHGNYIYINFYDFYISDELIEEAKKVLPEEMFEDFKSYFKMDYEGNTISSNVIEFLNEIVNHGGNIDNSIKDYCKRY